MQAVGESLLLAPYAASTVVAAPLIDALGTQAQRANYLPVLPQDDCIAVLAHDEQSSTHDRFVITARAVTDGEEVRLSGHKCLVVHALSADIVLFTAYRQDQFAVPTPLLAGRIEACPLVDGTLAANLLLDGLLIPASTLLGQGDANTAIGASLDRGLAAACAEAVGVLDKLLAATAEYTRNRHQFGLAIASFQALRHRLAEMVMHVEQARSMSFLAAVRSIEPDLVERAKALSAAKLVIGQACRFVGQQAVQLHGGMDVTDELDVSHYFKRLMAIELQWGSTEHHLQAFAAGLA